MSGLLITFEGIDFCGKSVQSQLLFDKIKNDLSGAVDGAFNKGNLQPDILLLREPGGTVISERIRSILLDKSLQGMDAITELLLYEAARSQLIAEVIIPSLHQNKIVLCDRFYDSTTAYQGYGRGISLQIIQAAHKIATHGVRPSVTFVIDLDPIIALERQKKAGRIPDRMELEDLEFHKRVRQGFLKIARQEANRVVVIDGNQTIDAIFDEIWNVTKNYV